ncbi:MAG: hypothetical protein ACKON9_00005 [Planctomycetaceae bacterium]
MGDSSGIEIQNLLRSNDEIPGKRTQSEGSQQCRDYRFTVSPISSPATEFWPPFFLKAATCTLSTRKSCWQSIGHASDCWKKVIGKLLS